MMSAGLVTSRPGVMASGGGIMTTGLPMGSPGLGYPGLGVPTTTLVGSNNMQLAPGNASIQVIKNIFKQGKKKIAGFVPLDIFFTSPRGWKSWKNSAFPAEKY